MPKLCVMPGDGVGQEVIPAAVQILQAAMPDVQIVEAEAGWGAYQKTGESLPEETLKAICDCGAGLFGAVQSPARKIEGYRSAILTLRKEFDLYANVRPVVSLPNISPRDGIDLIIMRENSEGLYIQRERLEGETAIAERVITRKASTRIARKTVGLMRMLGRKKMTIVHKANVLPLTDGLFRNAVREVAEGVKMDELLVDVAALKMLEDPARFDVIITTNLFGDILSDAAAYWGGGLGYAPSLNWGDDFAIAEPVHGSAPDIAGQGVANPIAAVLSAALLVRFVWKRQAIADRIERAVSTVLSERPELVQPGSVSTQRITEAILTEVDILNKKSNK